MAFQQNRSVRPGGQGQAVHGAGPAWGWSGHGGGTGADGSMTKIEKSKSSPNLT